MNRREAHVIGTTLEGRYRIDSVLARGGMSVVYRGVDLRLDRPIAVKVMDQRFSGDADFVRRFELEARSAARIHHSSVVAVHDQGVDHTSGGEQVFLVMELVDGGTLRDLLRSQGTLSPAVALSVLEPVLSALDSAHRAGMVHRDVKPENILISRDGVVKVADFGLVRALADAKTTSDSVILGTVDYLAPEQVTTGETDARGDVYAAGVVLYELLTGAPPFTGDTPFSTAYRHVNDRVPAPSERVAEVPAAMDALVLAATRREQEERPADAAALLARLRETRATLGLSSVAVPGVVPPAGPTSAAPGSAAGADDGTIVTQAVGGLPPESPNPASGIDGPTVRTPLPAGGPAPARPPGHRATQALSRNELPGGPNDAAAGNAAHAAHLGGLGDRGDRGNRGRRGRRGKPGGKAGGLFSKASTRLIAMGVVLVLALLLWWWNSAQWTSVPALAGMEVEEAEDSLTAAELDARLVHVPHNDIAAGVVIDSAPDQGRRIRRGDDVRVRVSSGLPTVPEITPGISPDEATTQIEDAELEVAIDEELAEHSAEVEEGAVIRTEPGAGTELEIDSTVTLILSLGPPPVPVPDVAGSSRDEAFAAIREAGFEPYELEAEFSESVDGGDVIRTDPPAETLIETPGTRIGVVLSNTIIAPYVTGDRLRDVRQTIEDLGLELEVQQFFGGDNARIVGQFPPSGTRLRPGDVFTVNTF
ncbi:Stk1 family PASTA domain-containing Ser/Thr kinase [Actinoalloteichus hymeniacidonis]|uniref:Stk1 family PASTA domain-containing Ser/Thr kinase n=1 Tax=Actinoalloteichus hymeniacidonis TaxID=340345 RepID=UPI0009FBB95C|nr:Stk1 family PASTA domain-containing Ser/Thr kinase [Actinoalloteichus hymeniacidonis]MBB5906820.1 serine/threonine-protein kinase [Actinoalloteichus hymeniacidonis]